MAKKARESTVSVTPAPAIGPESKPDGPPRADDVKRLPSPPNGSPGLPVSTLWQKGVSANPGGVPKGKRISTRVMEMMTWRRADLEGLVRDPEADARDHIAAKMLLRAMKDDDANADTNTVLDRTEGKVAQELNVRAESRTQLTDEQLAGIAAGTLDPARLVDLGPRVEPGTDGV